MTYKEFKKVIKKLHLWLGLLSGFVVFVVGLTGCLYVFQEEVDALFNAGVYRSVEPQENSMVSAGTIREVIDSAYAKEITYMNASVYPEGHRAMVVWVRGNDRRYTAFLLNPYTAEIMHRFSYGINFWAVVLQLHTSLLIPEYGADIVAISTLIFVFMLISGLVLWWPNKSRGFNKRMKIKWGASPKRLNFDLHNVLGFYATWIVLFIALTGLVMSYQWMDKAVYWLATGGDIPQKEERLELSKSDQKSGLDVGGKGGKTLASLVGNAGRLEDYYIEFPTKENPVYKLEVHYDEGSFYNRNDQLLIHEHTGEVLRENLWSNRNAGEKLQEANYNIHVGAILGLTGKFIAFFASLIATSLPVTGFYIWWGRTRKSKKKMG